MKKILLIAVLCFFLSGCGQAARESGFYQHDSMYRDWDHLWFSWFGYKDVSPKEAKESRQENWWGIPEGPVQTADQQRAKEKPDSSREKP